MHDKAWKGDKWAQRRSNKSLWKYKSPDLKQSLKHEQNKALCEINNKQFYKSQKDVGPGNLFKCKECKYKNKLKNKFQKTLKSKTFKGTQSWKSRAKQTNLWELTILASQRKV